MNFRAKAKVESITRSEQSDSITMRPVTTGSPEDNTYSKYTSRSTPSGMLQLTITNPDIMGNIDPGDIFYVDFTSV